MIKKAVKTLLALLVAPLVAFSQNEEKEYPKSIMASLDSLTMLLNQNCTKKNNACFTESNDNSSLNLDGKTIQQKLNSLESGIPLDYNKHVQAFINLYGVKKKELTSRILTLSQYYFPKFEEILDRQGLPLEFKYLAVVESALNPKAKSWAGACGLWQFIHSTGVLYGMKINSVIDERYNVEIATEAACRYFKNSYDLYGDWLLVIASYNCGPGNVNKAIRKSGGKRSFWEIMPYLPKETRGYVPAFIAVAYVMNYAEDLGLQPAEFDVHDLVETIEVDQKVYFNQISQALGISMEDLSYLNPSYKKNYIPGAAAGDEKQTLTLPYLHAMKFAEMKESIYSMPLDETYATVSKKITHVVKKRETLQSIARKYDITTADIKAWNVIKNNRVTPGKKLVIYTEVPAKTVIAADTKVNVNEEAKQQAATDSNTSATPVAKTKPVKKQATQTATEEATAQVKYYKVRAGDSLYSISKKYGLSVEKLKAYNNLTSKSVIKPGERLVISQGG